MSDEGADDEDEEVEEQVPREVRRERIDAAQREQADGAILRHCGPPSCQYTLSSTVGCRDCRGCQECRAVLDSAHTWSPKCTKDSDGLLHVGSHIQIDCATIPGCSIFLLFWLL